jgi:hypothetical protein
MKIKSILNSNGFLITAWILFNAIVFSWLSIIIEENISNNERNISIPEQLSPKAGEKLLIGSTYLYFPSDSINPYFTIHPDTVVVVDTSRGYVLFYGFFGEKSEEIRTFVKYSKLYKIDGGYNP